VADKEREKPKEWKRWDWREWETWTGDLMRIDWRSQGQQVGWIDGQDLYLEANAVYTEAQKLARVGATV